ncbi:conserved hypothetical protein [Talaromyces stipitatus ATCC 10500]|uniref:DUF7492 domain-containing protein n=1 Tax=Talaromyces stipitatus (strain ATCC 10500 / CBS 375.48 / QM 6759 / NRRL 1006) TaxID=441959 RepID=B8M8F0_TALSN|nr:uncharacterized protein TSTA_036840 [Talaromyces stipitatus ATCC 10500]EED20463.1 conserved hypothetical protein [Talaromyces stipitatus ATCC 10500]
MMQAINRSIVLVMILLSSLAQAHSWVEEMTLVSPDGKFTGKVGYPRGMILRTDPGFSDPLMQYQLPPQGEQLSASTYICRESQRTSNYTDKLPRLAAYPGAAVALRYQENGHVTTPWSKAGKPQNSGIVYVYGTERPKEDDHLLDIYKKWTLDGKGGDGRGRLLTSQYFDDGQCYQLNVGYISQQRQAEFHRVAKPGDIAGANLWCQTDVPLPNDLPVGKDYTLYWVWDWSTLDEDGKVTLPELYTTCMDVTIADAGKIAGTGATVAHGENNAKQHFASVTNYGENAIQTVWEKLAATPTVPTAVTPVPVNVTASVFYIAANSVIQANGAATSQAIAAGNAAVKAWAMTAAATATGARGAGAADAGGVGAAGATGATGATGAAGAGTGTGATATSATSATDACNPATVTITMTVTTTVAPSSAARSTGLLARRRDFCWFYYGPYHEA